ncbi:MAG: hypothetical protein Q9162_004799, partial [Coniocarpon cinnabarinum]
SIASDEIGFVDFRETQVIGTGGLEDGHVVAIVSRTCAIFARIEITSIANMGLFMIQDLIRGKPITHVLLMMDRLKMLLEQKRSEGHFLHAPHLETYTLHCYEGGELAVPGQKEAIEEALFSMGLPRPVNAGYINREEIPGLIRSYRKNTAYVWGDGTNVAQFWVEDRLIHSHPEESSNIGMGWIHQPHPPQWGMKAGWSRNQDTDEPPEPPRRLQQSVHNQQEERQRLTTGGSEGVHGPSQTTDTKTARKKLPLKLYKKIRRRRL